MSLSPYNPYQRYKYRAVRRVIRFTLAIIMVVILLGLGFWIGLQSRDQRAVLLEAQIEEIRTQRDQLQKIVTDLGAEAQTATMRLEQLQDIYSETVPEGPVENLVNLVREQIEEGMDPERLAFIIRSARPPHNCTEPETQRFVITTPAYNGPESVAEIGGGEVTIAGQGSSAKSKDGQEGEAWYDPAKRVSLIFKTRDGRIMKKSGVMPLYQSVVAEGREYRFTIEEGARSFAKVTYDSCDYP